MSLQAEWQYLQRTVPGVGAHMGPLEEALQKEFLPALFGESIGDDLRSLLCHSMKWAGLGVPNPTEAAERSHSTSVECCEVLVASLLEGQLLSYGHHKGCVRQVASGAQLERECREDKELRQRQAEMTALGKYCLERAYW
eukprot:4244159-Ditylum_brightwellii.AAC.1